MSVLILRALRTHCLNVERLELAIGDIVVIQAPSGSGKSTLLRAIADLDPHEGDVLLDEVNARRITAPQWRRQVCYLAANSGWWHEHARPHFEHPEKLPLAELNLDKTVLDKTVAQLSTGELQRLALLRALEREPRVLLLDEPTAALDHDSTLRVEQRVREYLARHKGCALWVSHDREQATRLKARCFTIREQQLEPLT